jgi:hypothetical protein
MSAVESRPVSVSPLRRVLEVFERAGSPIALGQVARELDLPDERLEGMIEHWIRKGRIRESAQPDCGSCGVRGRCPFVMTMPRSLELATDADGRALPVRPVVPGSPAITGAGCGCGAGSCGRA